MEDIFQWCREGNALQVRVWLDDTEHDMNQGDDHGFSPLHWACKEGHIKIVEMLIRRGARINVTNMGDDTPLHLAAAHGHRPIVQLLLQNRVDVNFTNEHGNSPLHYACFWGYSAIAEDLVIAGALVSLANKDGDTPLDKTKGQLVQRLHELAVNQGQDLKKIQFKDQSWLGLKTRSRDATLSRHKGININELALHTRIAVTPSGETWRGRWQKNDIVAKIIAVRECTPRVQRDFNEEFPKLRIFSHPNILPVVGCCVSPPSLVVISQYMSWGSLYSLLHGGAGGRVVVDAAAALRLARDVAAGLAYLHSLQRDRILPTYHLNSKHVMIDEDLTARINMADSKFSFQEKGRVYALPGWPPKPCRSPAPRGTGKPLTCGVSLSYCGSWLRERFHSPICPQWSICMNEDPGKRPSFEMILPILEKMKR
ncbi:unnamed protein product [Pieris macdunnoughi]|uniref:Protein kinase domain-containing protein n=1 Tax=Pieris macdunnoughi TaxID=345717 RepID=A0A821SXH7_9NEOP|nr:unnamed protein product [Pieris macdunnoughi]